MGSFTKAVLIGSVLVTLLAAVTSTPAGATPPFAETREADEIGSESARLNGSVSPFGFESILCEFEYGPVPSLGLTAPCTGNLSGEEELPVSAVISGLKPSTIYSFRIHYAWTGFSTEFTELTGQTKSFTTLAGSGTPPGDGQTVNGGGQVPAPTPAPTVVQLCRAPGKTSIVKPKGFVVTKREGNCIEARLPADGIVICEVSPPAGFVRIAFGNYDRCGPRNTFAGGNGIRIRRPSPATLVCWTNRLPSEYVVTEVTTTEKCGPTYSNRPYNAYRTEQASDGIVMCTRTNVPSGYVVTAEYAYAENLSRRDGRCGPVYGDNPPDPNAYKIELPHDGILMCNETSIPTGYVATERRPVVETGFGRVPNGKCGPVYGTGPFSPNSTRITHPRDGLTICSRAPSGFVVFEVQEDNRPLDQGTCGPSPSTAWVIKRPAPNMLICSLTAPPTFVVAEPLNLRKCGSLKGFRYNGSKIVPSS
jgi:hypothetical protein